MHVLRQRDFRLYLGGRFCAALALMHLTQAICAALFIALTATASSAQALGGNATWPFFAVLAVSGTARAFSGPAVQSFTPFLVPREQFANAVGWSASANQTAGPSRSICSQCCWAESQRCCPSTPATFSTSAPTAWASCAAALP